jgi:pyruvate dehydrogenase E2 component (dihydrolipoamide acetyltransferase)
MNSVIMPALEMAQEAGRLVHWLKREGDTVAKGDPLMEIETDKVTVEIESPASGRLGGVRAAEGDLVPVGQVIAWLLADGERPPADFIAAPTGRTHSPLAESKTATPLARKVAGDMGVDLNAIPANGKRIEKADVLAYLAQTQAQTQPGVRLKPASPKARRLAAERNIDMASLSGSGPEGAVLAADVANAPASVAPEVETPGTVWRVMAERMTHSWTTVPHFYLIREVEATALVEMRARLAGVVEKRAGVNLTYTDLLVKLTAGALCDHPRLNAAWAGNGLRHNDEINIGLATAVEAGLVVPVIHRADALRVSEIAAQRKELVARAAENKLRPADIAAGTFTITNLGMYGVDAFNAIVNPPQAAILAVGRIADRVIPVNGQPAVRSMLTLSLSCDHRVVDGARAAKFLAALANLIEEPWGLLA